MKKVYWLFTRSTFSRWGGYQTLLLRYTFFLDENDCEVFLFSPFMPDSFKNSFPSTTHFVTLNCSMKNIFSSHLRSALDDLTYVKCPDAVVCTDEVAFLAASYLSYRKNISTKYLLCLLQPDSVEKLSGFHVRNLLVRMILRRSARNVSVVAMNRKLEDGFLSRNCFSNKTKMIPLPLDLKSFQVVEKSLSQVPKIVSIGRLADYKTYNIYMIELLAKIRSSGYDCRYSIYGSGPYEKEIREQIEKYNLIEYVDIFGDVAYSKMPDVLIDAWAFIGQGTAALEAAATGTPVIYAFPSDRKGLTRGFLSDFDLAEKGGFAEEDSENYMMVEDCIRELLKSSRQDVGEIGNLCKEAALKYSKSASFVNYDLLINETKRYSLDLPFLARFLMFSGAGLVVYQFGNVIIYIHRMIKFCLRILRCPKSSK